MYPREEMLKVSVHTLRTDGSATQNGSELYLLKKTEMMMMMMMMMMIS